MAQAGERVVKRISTDQGRLIAWQKDHWDKAGPGPDYPTRCEIWLQSQGRPRKVLDLRIQDSSRRQRVCLEGWDKHRLIVTRREFPFRRMSDDYVTSMRSCLWLCPPEGAPQAWSPGQWPQVGILDVGRGLVVVGSQGEVGGGAGMPPWTAWKTLLVTDLSGLEKHRLSNLEASDQTFGQHCLSPDGRYLATYTVAPGVDVARLEVRSMDGKVVRTIESAGLFRWKSGHLLQVGDPPRLVDVETR